MMKVFLLLVSVTLVACAAPTDLLEKFVKILEENQAEDKNIYKPNVQSFARSIFVPIQVSKHWDEQGSWELGVFYREEGKGETPFHSFAPIGEYKECRNPCVTITGLEPGRQYTVYTKVKLGDGSIIQSRGVTIRTKDENGIVINNKETKHVYTPSVTVTEDSIKFGLQVSKHWGGKDEWKLGIFYKEVEKGAEQPFGNFSSIDDFETCQPGSRIRCVEITDLRPGTTYRVYTKIQWDDATLIGAGTTVTTRSRGGNSIDVNNSGKLKDVLENLLDLIEEE